MDDMLTTDLAGLSLRNPVMLAAGTAGVLDEMSDALDLARVGAIVTKSITRLPREGNQTWRILPGEAGMLNAIGLANIGMGAFVANVAPRVSSVPTRVIGSVAGYSIDDYVVVAAAMNDVEAIHAVELNVSCPNVHGGRDFGADPRLLSELVAAVRPVLTHTRLFVKLSPIAVGVSGVGIADFVRATIDPHAGAQPAGPNQRPGADAVCLANTTPAMAIDVETGRPKLANVTGGLSGPAVHPIAVKLVYDAYRLVCKSTGTPIVGIGGVMRWEHAAEFILAGATAVEVGTGLFADPRCPIAIAKGLAAWVTRMGKGSVKELIGGVKV